MNYILALLIAAGLLVFGLAWLGDVQNQRIIAEARAEAILINANAQASATLMTAAVPMTIVILAGLVILILAIGWTLRQRQKVIERQVIYVLPAGASRRELWDTLSNQPKTMVLPEKVEARK